MLGDRLGEAYQIADDIRDALGTDDVQVHRLEALLAAGRERRVARGSSQALRGVRVQAKVQEGVQHAGHGHGGPGADAHEQRVPRVAEDPPDPFADDDSWLDRRLHVLGAADPKRLAAIFRGAGTADLPLPEALATIAAPTLVLAWSGDPGHPVSTAKRLGALLPNSDVVISSTREDLDTWTSRCAAFLDER